jgi:hypothetical protein
MNNNCWYSLNIDFSNALRKDWVWKIPDLKKSNIQSECEISRVFNTEWLNYMNSIGVPINHVVFFYRPSNGDQNAHIDINGSNNKLINYALNWIIEGQDSEMTWYNLPEKDPEIKYSMANAPYSDWPVSELGEKIDTANIQNYFTLVRTDIPHKIATNEKSRWAISARSPTFNTWSDAVNYFRSKNLLIER